MPLNLYRRHYRVLGKCVGNHPPDSRSYQTEELRRAWKRCHCPIYADGTLAGEFRRKNTGATDWDSAKSVADQWQSLGSWNKHTNTSPQALQVIAVPSAFPSQSATEQVSTVTIQQAAEAYLANRTGRHISDATQRKYKTFLKQLQAFADSRGYVLLKQLTVPDIDVFYNSWKDGVRAKGKKLERMKGFFQFCVKRKWIPENPASDLEAPIGSSTAAHRVPFSDQEVDRILKACGCLPPAIWKNQNGCGTWTGEDVKTLIVLMLWTGLRISDAVTFDMSRLIPHPDGGANVFLRMHKTKGPLYTWVNEDLYQQLLAREQQFGAKIFSAGYSTRLEGITELWRRRLARVFRLAGPMRCGVPTPHIFRHTFVRFLLQRGVPPSDVAELVGDTVAVLLKHYAQWVPERQERLTAILREKLSGRATAS